MAYDENNKVIVVFGGFGNGSHLADTWVLNMETKAWNNMAPVSAPSARAATSMVYDGVGGQMIIFGGFGLGHSVVSNETWTYTVASNNWIRVETQGAPSARASYGMALDENRRELVLFGGFTENEYFNDVWVYDIANQEWKSRNFAGELPAPRGAMSFVYDVENNQFIMFGGFSDKGFYSDTWILDPAANKWTKQELSTVPPPLRTRMIYDESSGNAILFGGDVIQSEGHQTSPVPSDKTWSYDPSNRAWSEILTSEAPNPRSLHGVAYDRANDSIIIFGGTDSLIDDANFVGREFQDTWVFSNKVDNPSMNAMVVLVPAAAVIVVGLFVLVKKNRIKFR
jgi:N-acetylneuraminic acid mutarotase